MIENLLTDHELYIKSIKDMHSDFVSQMDFLFLKSMLREEHPKEIQIKLPVCSQNIDYFYNKNYQYFSDRFNAKIELISDNEYFIINYKNETITKEELEVLEKDVQRIFTNTLNLINRFYEIFEVPFNENTTKKFVLDYLTRYQKNLNTDGIILNLFVPCLNTIEDLGIILDFNDVTDPNNSFAFYTGDRIKFISRDQIHMEYFRYNTDVLTQGVYQEESKEWFGNVLSNLRISQFTNFLDNIDHIRDYLNSEDIRSVFPFIHKISLNDMTSRSQKWLNKISKVKIKEVTGDTVSIFDYDNFSIVQLLTTNALDRESSYLNHCIGRGSYDHCLHDDSSKLYSVRNKKNEPVATIEISPSNSVIQIQGYKNTLPDSSVKPIIKRFFKEKSISFENYRYAYAFIN